MRLVFAYARPLTIAAMLCGMLAGGTLSGCSKDDDSPSVDSGEATCRISKIHFYQSPFFQRSTYTLFYNEDAIARLETDDSFAMMFDRKNGLIARRRVTPDEWRDTLFYDASDQLIMTKRYSRSGWLLDSAMHFYNGNDRTRTDVHLFSNMYPGQYQGVISRTFQHNSAGLIERIEELWNGSSAGYIYTFTYGTSENKLGQSSPQLNLVLYEFAQRLGDPANPLFDGLLNNAVLPTQIRYTRPSATETYNLSYSFNAGGYPASVKVNDSTAMVLEYVCD